MTTSERIANNNGIVTGPDETAVNDFRDYIDPAMKEIAWQAWKHRGGLLENMTTSEAFEKWYAEQI